MTQHLKSESSVPVFHERKASHQEELKRKASESYPWWKMFLILLGSPFLIINAYKLFVDTRSLLDLWEEGYKKMFWQRLILLILGVLFWFVIIRSMEMSC